MSIRWKLAMTLIAAVLVPVASIFYYSSIVIEDNIIDQVTEDLKFSAEIYEGYVLLFFEHQRIRAIDWSSDIKIKSITEAIGMALGDPEQQTAIEAQSIILSDYIREEKISLDSSVLMTEIYSIDGILIATTKKGVSGCCEKREIDKLQIEFAFSDILNSQSGTAIVSELLDSSYGMQTGMQVYHVSSPLFSSETGEIVGVLVNHVLAEELDRVLSGQLQLDLGARTATLGRQNTLEAYLVNSDGIFVTSSRFIEGAVLNQAANTKIVRACFGSGEEVSGFFDNYRGARVLSISMCPQNQWWMLIIEIEKDEVLSNLSILNRRITIFSIIIALLALLSSMIISERDIRRIRRNIFALSKIAVGEFGTRIKVTGKDEITQTAYGINEMAAVIEESIEKIKRSEEENRSLVENSVDCIKLLDKSGKVLRMNKAGLIEHGLKSQKDALNWDFFASISKEHRKIVKGALEKANSGEISTIEVKHTIKGSNRAWCRVTFAPIIDSYNAENKILVVSSDISLRKKSEEQVNQLGELKDVFIRIVSHQLRTPLSAVRWNLESLIKGDLGKLKDSQKEFLNATYEAEVNVIDRLQELLTALDIQESRILFKKTEVSLESLLGSVQINYEGDIKVKRIKYSNIWPKKSLPLVKVDIDKIRKVFEVLIDNAITYTPDKGSITAELKLEKKNVKFEIIDSGVGIPKAEQRRIFERFYRASNASRMKTDASGIGLSIAKYYVEQHDGKIGFDSTEEKGSTFWFTIPVEK
ncbi:MAG: ATP-binding protein [Patescibacteria group bacterium]